MGMDTARDLFQHELLDMYDAEHRIITALPSMVKEATDPALQKAFEQHEQQTQQHIKRIEDCCKSLGIEAKRETCPGMAGLITEHERFLKEKPSPPVLTLFLMDAGQKVEHYEIVGYRGLIDLAKQVGETACVDLLSQTLNDEESMAEQLETIEQKGSESLVQQASRGS